MREPNLPVPLAAVVLIIALIAGVCIAQRSVDGVAQRCRQYEAICVQAMADYGFGDDPELLAYIHDTIRCESQFDPQAVGEVDRRDRGLVQINSFFHPQVSDAEAFDPRFAIRYMVWHWSQNRALWWTCYVRLAERFGTPAALRPPPFTMASVPQLAPSPSGSATQISVAVMPAIAAEPYWLAELRRLLFPPIAPAPSVPWWAWIFP